MPSLPFIKIGLRFIWIDSLCIIQDDHDDWPRESKKMGLVYGNAYLTIAASHAFDSSQGFFSNAPNNKIKPSSSLISIQPDNRIRAVGDPSMGNSRMIRLPNIKKAKNVCKDIRFNEDRGTLMIRSQMKKAPKIITPLNPNLESFGQPGDDLTPARYNTFMEEARNTLPVSMACTIYTDQEDWVMLLQPSSSITDTYQRIGVGKVFGNPGFKMSLYSKPALFDSFIQELVPWKE